MAKEVYMSSRTRSFANREEAIRNGLSTTEQAVLARAFYLQRRYGNISGNEPFVPQNEQRNNTRIRRTVDRMLG